MKTITTRNAFRKNLSNTTKKAVRYLRNLYEHNVDSDESAAAADKQFEKYCKRNKLDPKNISRIADGAICENDHVSAIITISDHERVCLYVQIFRDENDKFSTYTGYAVRDNNTVSGVDAGGTEHTFSLDDIVGVYRQNEIPN